MTVLGKTAVAALCGGALTATMCYVGGFFSSKEISWEALSADANYETVYTDAGTVAKGYAKYFVGPTKEGNRRWWEESYRSRYKPDRDDSSKSTNLSTEFGTDKVTVGYSQTVATALNKVCGEAYKQVVNTAVDFASPNGTDNKDKLGRDLLRYCSPLGQKPVAIGSTEGYGSNTVGAETNKQNVFVSARDEDKEANKGFWDAQQKWFSSLKGNKAPEDAYFGQFFEGNGEDKKMKANVNIKDECERAYKATKATTSAETDKPLPEDVEKYCSFKIAS